MLAIVLILIISFAWAVVINQIYVSNFSNIIKTVLILLYLIISSVSLLVSILLIPIFIKIIQKRQAKFNNSTTLILATILIATSFVDIINSSIYEYKCNISKDYEIVVVDNNFTISDLESMYVKSSNNQSDFKFTQKINSINVYKDTNATKIIAKIYNIHCPNSLILSSIQREISGTSGGLSCGYVKTGLLKYNYEIKQILKDSLLNNNTKTISKF
ncbi:hypothetical protein [Campylobacter sp. RM16188]|uniref:hypothetical protein n=1 Tax=Campylobacter sp. RM16188 TaxID=1705725 RepID=UPI0015528440|nr:hypothetical protein [Campylobacter sp. RM16188]